MLNVIFGLVGLLAGVIINVLADNLPEQTRPQPPYCLQCGHLYGPVHWLGLGRRLWGGNHCPECGAPVRPRTWLVEASTAVLFALLPSLIPVTSTLIINSFHIAVLILIIVIDLEHKLILNAVTFPATAAALLGSVVVPAEENTFRLALVGAAVGFFLFFMAFWAGQLLFGPGALGYGDVKLALLLGTMLGFHRVVFALMLGVILGGIGSVVVVLWDRRVNRHTYLPYGQYLAVAGIGMLIWGVQVYQSYIR
ncbi:MAG: prepilin peptidase [Anaerolineae bacterium]